MGELRILLLVDGRGERAPLLAELRRGLGGARLLEVGSAEELEPHLLRGDFEAVLAVPPLPWCDAAALVARLKGAFPYLPVLFYTAHQDVELAVAALKAGLDDYLLRSAESYARLPLAVEVAVKRNRARRAAAEAERIHRDRATQLEALLETIPAAVWVAEDPECRRIAGNRTAHELLGVPVGRNMSKSAPPGEAPTEYEVRIGGRAVAPAELPIQRAAATRRPVLGQEIEILPRHGEPRVLYGNAVPLFAETGALRGALAAFLDVTALRRAEAALREANRGLRLLADAGQAVSESFDFETILDRVARLALPRLADWCTLDVVTESGEVERVAVVHADPALQETAERLKAYAPQPDHPNFALEVLATGEPLLVAEVSSTATDATLFDEEHGEIVRALGVHSFMCVPLTAHGRVLGAWGFVWATAERRYGAAELTLAQELARRAGQAIYNARLYREAQAASAAKDHFLAALSHELRTPLTPVLAIVSRLERAPRAAVLAPELAVIRRNVEQEARLIDDLLDQTRIARGKLALERREVDLRRTLAEAVEMSDAREAEARGLVLDVDLPSPGERGWLDGPRIGQVLSNLLNNAVKFTPKGGRIAVRARVEDRARREGERGQRRLALEVRDTGIGIEPELLPRLFTPFEQGREGRPAARGLGLGLSISRAIVELHGGTLTAASDGPGRGATLTARLPLDPPPARRPEPLPAGDGPDALEGAELRILLVEDHADSAEALADLLAVTGHRVTWARDAAEALARAGHGEAAQAGLPQGGPRCEFDLVISDLGLPGMSGFELMQHLHGRFGLPGIALSGYGMEEDVRRSREAGFARHLTKPVDVEALRAAIAATVADSRRGEGRERGGSSR